MNEAYNHEALEAVKNLDWRRFFLLAALKRKIHLGNEKREGWLGENPFFLFWCNECGHYAKDYPHGFIENQHLICSFCSTRHDFVPLRVVFAQLFTVIRITIRYRLFPKSRKSP